MYDCIIIGSGPAGLSAAITLRSRKNSVAVISNDRRASGLYKAARVDNYPGLPGVSGAHLSDVFYKHAVSAGAEIIDGRVTSCVRGKNGFAVSYGQNTAEAKSLILAVGALQTAALPGEAEFLGKGVSYCATCDGMLYRKRKVVIASYSAVFDEEIAYLREIGCDVVAVTESKDVVIRGEIKVTSCEIAGAEYECDCVFILRKTVAPSAMLPKIETAGGYIKVDSAMKTNIDGVFAAGDCTGDPKQISKAVGDGQKAAFSAMTYIMTNRKPEGN